ncbi:20289_t:CDS:2, partial [Gigaspora rosea]
MPMSEDMQESLWKKCELFKTRNQMGVNKWCKTSLLLDKALFTGDIEYVQLAKQVAFENAYVVKLFSGKHERARFQIPGMYMPVFAQSQPFVHPNWQQVSSQGMFVLLLGNKAFSPNLS